MKSAAPTGWGWWRKLDARPRPRTAFYLSSIGGFLEFLICTIINAMGTYWFVLGLLDAILVALWMICGVVILLFALEMYREPTLTHKPAIWILILSILGVNILALIGGILAISWGRKQGVTPPPPPPLPPPP